MDRRALALLAVAVALLCASRLRAEPTAALSVEPSGLVCAPATLHLDASASQALAERSIVRLQIDPGDGSPPTVLEGQALAQQPWTLDHRYPLPGGFRASVQVEDDAGETTEASLQVLVGRETAEVDCLGPPSVRIVLPEGELAAGAMASVEGEVAPGAADVLVRRWDLDDGSVAVGPTLTRSWAAGAHHLRFCAVDADGLRSCDERWLRVGQGDAARLTAHARIDGEELPRDLLLSASLVDPGEQVASLSWELTTGDRFEGESGSVEVAESRVVAATVSALDEQGGVIVRDRLLIAVSVQEGEPSPPRILSVPPPLPASGAFSYSLAAWGTPPFTWTLLEGGGAGVQLDEESALVRWVPPADAATATRVRVQVANAAGVDEQSFVLVRGPAVDATPAGADAAAAACHVASAEPGAPGRLLPLLLALLALAALRRRGQHG